MAYLLGVSTDTLREVIRKHADFPMRVRGAVGVPYEFDADQVAAWWRRNAEKIEEQEQARRRQLDLWRREIYGKGEDPTDKPLTVAERRALAEAARVEDYNRFRRGELVERARCESRLMTALIALRNELLQVPSEYARRHGLGRQERLELEALFEQRLSDLADRLGDADYHRQDGA